MMALHWCREDVGWRKRVSETMLLGARNSAEADRERGLALTLAVVHAHKHAPAGHATCAAFWHCRSPQVIVLSRRTWSADFSVTKRRRSWTVGRPKLVSARRAFRLTTRFYGWAAAPAKTTIRVLIVDDQAIVRKGICALLPEVEAIAVVGEASNG